MKRRFYALMLVVAMLAMTLVGCGSDTTDTTNTTNDVTINTEVEESGDDVVTEMPTEEPTTTPEVEEPVVEPTEEPTTEDEESEFYSDSYQWVFPEGLDGFTDKFVLASDETMSFNCTHYVDPNGNEINFTWVGPTVLGENAGLGNNGKTLNLGNSSGEYALRAFTTGELSPEDYEETINYSKETIISFASTDVSYIEDGYYNAIIEDNYLSYTFAVEGVGDNANCQGYCHFILDFENGACYQFTYLEDISIYDDERALSVVNSLEYWDYIPEE